MVVPRILNRTTCLYRIEAAECMVHLSTIFETLPILLPMTLLYLHPLTLTKYQILMA